MGGYDSWVMIIGFGCRGILGIRGYDYWVSGSRISASGSRNQALVLGQHNGEMVRVNLKMIQTNLEIIQSELKCSGD